MTFTLALVQMRVIGGQPARNLASACDWIGRAVDQGAQVILLPEALNLGWTHPSAGLQAEAIPEGASCSTLRAAAQRHGVYVCAGLVERSGERVFNSAVLIGPSGDLLLLHRKLNELDIGHDCYAQGDRLGVVPTPLGTLGLMICADGFAVDQVIGRALGYMGADMILSPSSWAVPADHDNLKEPYGQLWLDNYGPVARAFGLWIASASNVGPIEAGPWAGRRCIGCSLVVGPDGRQRLMGPYGADAECVLTLSIDTVPRPARGALWEEYWRRSAG